MKKRALSWLLALTMLLTLAPQALPTWASAAGTNESGSTTESKLSANTYSALGLSRDVDTKGLDDGKQPYGKAEPGNTVATNVINELYVNFNGSIHYGWSILDNIPMEYRDDCEGNWTNSRNFYGAMDYWRPNQQPVHYGNGNKKEGALFAENGSKTGGVHDDHLGKSINSANKHLTYQYSKSEAFSPNTGKDNYVAEMTIDSASRVNLYIYQVEGGNKRYVRSKFVCNASASGGDANDKTNIIYNWEYDAMYDIAAGDMDGDGYDEIAVYAQNKVYVYSFKGGNLSSSPIATHDVTPPTGTSDDAGYKKLKTAVVTLAFGDLNADDKDELVIAENIGYGATNIDTGKVGIYRLETNESTKKNTLVKAMKDDILLAVPGSSGIFNAGPMVRYANVATGDIDGDYQDELVIAGYISSKTPNATCNRGDIAYMIVKGGSDNQFTHSDWKAVDKNKNRIDLLDRVVDNNNQLIPPVALTCAATQGVGYAEQVFLGGYLYSVTGANEQKTNVENYSLNALTRISTNREYKKDNGNKANKEEIFVVNVVAGNFNGNRNGQEQIVYAFGMKHDDSDRYWYDIGYINKKEPGDTHANESSGYWYGQEQVMNYESSYNRDQNKSRASLYLSLAAVDCDNDSTLMRYKGQTVTWTKPEVLTVLQSAPYFQDLEDTRGYLDQGQTGLGKSKAAGDKVTAGGSLSLGTYVSFEQDFSVFGVKVASIEAEAQSKNSFTYAYEETKKKETEINYSGSAGDDYAVVYAVPYMEYQYETWVPGYTVTTEYLKTYLADKLGKAVGNVTEDDINKAMTEFGIKVGTKVEGSWQPSSVMVPMEPAKVLITVDDYDEIAEQTEGLEPIRGNILNSTPGDPSTYDNGENPRDGFNPIGEWQTVTKGAGGNITVTETSTTEKSHDFEYSYEFEAKVGAGAGGLTVGVLAGFGANAGGGISTSSSKSYSATVDNLPKDASKYGFSWQFGWRNAKLNNNDVLVLEYQIKDVAQLPSPPKNLRVESVTSDSVTLSWDPVTGAGAYNIYQVGSDGETFPMKTLAGTATSWTNTGLSNNRSYTYVAETITQAGQKSLTSASVNTCTLEGNKENFKILTQPEVGETEAAAGDNISLTVTAEYKNANGTLNDLHYRWQTYNTTTRKWENIDGATSQTYTVKVTDQNDGKRYRCQVYSSASLYLYSKEVTLKVGRSTTMTTLNKPAETVYSAYTKTSTVPAKDAEGKTQFVQVQATDATYTDRYKYQYKTEGTPITVYVKTETTTATDGTKTTTTTYYNDSGTPVTPTKKYTLSYQKPQTGETEAQEIRTEISAPTEDTLPTEPVKYSKKNEAGADEEYVASKAFKIKIDATDAMLYFHQGSNDEDSLPDLWFVKIGENTYTADLEEYETLKIGETEIDITALEPVMVDTSEQIMTEVQEPQDGQEVTLTANVGKENEGGQKIDGSVTFKIVNTTGDGGVTETVQVGTHGKATMNWKPTTAGVYVVTAIYSGSEMFKESQSQSYTINVVTPGEQKLVLSGENMTYGDTQELKATLFDGKSDSESTTGVSAKPVTVTYAVTRDGTAVTDEITAEGKFTPTQAGTYTITATYTLPNDTTTTENNASGDAGDTPSTTQNTITTTKVIVVGRKTVKIVPKVVQGTDGKTITYDLPGVPEADQSAIRAAIVTSCTGLTNGAKAGIYPIVVKYNENNSINSKYLIVRDNDQKYEVKGDVVHVTNATTDSNGKVKLQYTDSKGNTYDVGENGQSLDVPKGVKLTATAMPNLGYRVEQWKVNSNTQMNGVTPVTNPTFEIQIPENTTLENWTVEATFTQIYYKLNYSIENGGEITAKYLTDNGGTGTPFNSGDQLSPLQKVQLTAEPASGQAICEWQVDGETIKNKDGTNYTGATYEVSSISKETSIVVKTEQTSECPVTVTVVGSDNQPLGNATVSFNPAREATDGTYPGQKNQSLTITLNIPDSLIVESWSTAAGQEMQGTLSSDKKKLTISNLRSALNLTVKCVTPNMYTVTQEVNAGGCIEVYKGLTDNTPLSFTDSAVDVPQASLLRVLVKPNQGYQVNSVTVGDTPPTLNDITGSEDKSFVINSVYGPTTIHVEFVKKPVVTFSVVTPTGENAHGSLTANNLPISDSPITLPYGSTDVITFTATPNVGYEVESWTVNGTAVNGQKVANSDNQSYTYTPGTDGITDDLTVTVSFKALPKATVHFSVFDQTPSSGMHGTLTASVTRKGMDSYKVENSNTGSLEVYRDSVVRFTATPDSGYKVGVWQLNDAQWENQPELEITGETTSPQNVQVQFDLIGDKVTYGFKSDGASDKAQISAKYTPQGSSEEQDFKTESTPGEDGNITFTVSELDTDYEIEGWYVDGKKQDGETGPTFTHAVTKNVGLEVQVKIIRKSYPVKFSATNGTVLATVEGASITSGASVVGDKRVTFTATPVSNTGYTFAGWTVNGNEQMGTGTTLTLIITQDTTVSAKFTLDTASYAVNYGVVGTETNKHGNLTAEVASWTFTSGATKPADSKVVFKAQPESGYRVKGWYSNEGGTTAIDGTKVEQETYTIDSLTAEANVYVAFEKIPTYEITVTTTGLGHVTAKVNHVDAEITGGKLTVNHHDNVVFTAVPDTKQNLTNWTLDGDNKGNSSMTLTLDDVTNTHDVTANFATSQRITFRTIYDDSKGTLTAQAGYNTSLETINASSTTGIQVDNGKKIVLTAKPNSGYMVEKWIVNTTEVTRTNMEDLGVTMDHYLSNELTIDNLSKSTTVEVKFKQYNGHTIPGSNTGYTVTVVKYKPDTTYEGENSGKVREDGDITFTVSPATGYTGITKLIINGYDCIEKSGTVSGCTAVTVDKIENGEVTVTVKGVTQAISLMAEALKLQTENKDLTEVPSGLSTKYTNLESLENDLRASVKTRNSKVENIRLLDIELQYWNGSTWEKVTNKAHFPAGGITVEVPYSKLGDATKDDNFTVIHMLTVGMNGKQPGDVEEITPITKGENGISFHVTSLSPFAIGWTKYVAPTPGGGGGGGGAVSTYTLTFDTNGGSAIDKITKDSGTTIDLAAYKPTRAGYTFAGWFSDKALTKAVTSVKLTANTTVYAKWTQNGGTAQNPFVDVKEGAYYYDAVLWAVEQKITSGTSATTFSPDASCTRAQMVTFLWRAAGSPKVENGKNPFTDVKADAYYYDAVLWAVEKGVTSGTSATTFSPDATVTRGQTVTFLYRNAGSPEVSGTMPFTDVEADAYYAKAVQWAVQQKITTGTSETTFSPMSDCTRGQIVTFLYRAK